MNLDGELVGRGKRVFCLALGEGVVLNTLPIGGCSVAFDKGQELTYSEEGVSGRFNRRTLYCRPPDIMHRPQDTPKWLAAYTLDAAAMKLRYESLFGDG